MTISALVGLAAVCAGTLLVFRIELSQVDIHSGRWRITTRLLGIVVRQSVRETEFSQLLTELGGTVTGPPEWRLVGESGYSLFGQRVLRVCKTVDEPGSSFGHCADLIAGSGALHRKFRLSSAGQHALLQRLMHAYDLPGQQGDKYWKRASLFLLMHPSLDDPQAPLLGPDDFPTPQEALDDQVWYGKWVPIVDPGFDLTTQPD